MSSSFYATILGEDQDPTVFKRLGNSPSLSLRVKLQPFCEKKLNLFFSFWKYYITPQIGGRMEVGLKTISVEAHMSNFFQNYLILSLHVTFVGCRGKSSSVGFFTWTHIFIVEADYSKMSSNQTSLYSFNNYSA